MSNKENVPPLANTWKISNNPPPEPRLLLRGANGWTYAAPRTRGKQHERKCGTTVTRPLVATTGHWWWQQPRLVATAGNHPPSEYLQSIHLAAYNPSLTQHKTIPKPMPQQPSEQHLQGIQHGNNLPPVLPTAALHKPLQTTTVTNLASPRAPFQLLNSGKLRTKLPRNHPLDFSAPNSQRTATTIATNPHRAATTATFTTTTADPYCLTTTPAHPTTPDNPTTTATLHHAATTANPHCATTTATKPHHAATPQCTTANPTTAVDPHRTIVTAANRHHLSVPDFPLIVLANPVSVLQPKSTAPREFPWGTTVTTPAFPMIAPPVNPVTVTNVSQEFLWGSTAPTQCSVGKHPTTAPTFPMIAPTDPVTVGVFQTQSSSGQEVMRGSTATAVLPPLNAATAIPGVSQTKSTVGQEFLWTTNHVDGDQFGICSSGYPTNAGQSALAALGCDWEDEYLEYHTPNRARGVHFRASIAALTPIDSEGIQCLHNLRLQTPNMLQVKYFYDKAVKEHREGKRQPRSNTEILGCLSPAVRQGVINQMTQMSNNTPSAHQEIIDHMNAMYTSTEEGEAPIQQPPPQPHSSSPPPTLGLPTTTEIQYVSTNEDTHKDNATQPRKHQPRWCLEIDDESKYCSDDDDLFTTDDNMTVTTDTSVGLLTVAFQDMQQGEDDGQQYGVTIEVEKAKETQEGKQYQCEVELEDNRKQLELEEEEKVVQQCEFSFEAEKQQQEGELQYQQLRQQQQEHQEQRKQQEHQERQDHEHQAPQPQQRPQDQKHQKQQHQEQRQQTQPQRTQQQHQEGEASYQQTQQQQQTEEPAVVQQCEFNVEVEEQQEERESHYQQTQQQQEQQQLQQTQQEQQAQRRQDCCDVVLCLDCEGGGECSLQETQQQVRQEQVGNEQNECTHCTESDLNNSVDDSVTITHLKYITEKQDGASGEHRHEVNHVVVAHYNKDTSNCKLQHNLNHDCNQAPDETGSTVFGRLQQVFRNVFGTKRSKLETSLSGDIR